MNNEPIRTLPISIVIPTYFEEKLLPRLLASIKKQLVQPLEVIVSDGFSTDRTREIARSYGAKVVDGGKVAAGRNNGAYAAQGDLLLSIDADSELTNEWTLLDVYLQFLKSNADIASVFYKPDKRWGMTSSEMAPHVVFTGVNALKHLQKLLKKVVIAELGIFVLVKRKVFDKVGGFDGDYDVGEDKKFFTDAIKHGYNYVVLNVIIVTSTRRFRGFGSIAISLFAVFGAFFLGFFGFKPTSPLRKMFWKLYGELGGKGV